MTTFTNMTPHDINILTNDIPLVTFEPSGETIRLSEEWITLGNVAGIDILHCTFTESSLPPVKANHFYIVSAMVANAYPKRLDFLIVAKTVRDDNGRIIGCEALASVLSDESDFSSIESLIGMCE